VSFHKPTAVDSDGNPLPPKYDPGQFIVAPSDVRGVSYRLTFRVAPDLEKAVDQVLACNRFPFTTRGDVLRFCVREGLRILEQLEPMTSVTKRLDMLSTILGEENSHAEFLNIFQHLAATVEKYLADQAADQAKRILAIAKHQFEEMPEGHWRQRYLKELASRFGPLMSSNGQGAQLPSPKYHTPKTSHAAGAVGLSAGSGSAGPASQGTDG
jgi:hypothetical protein